MCCFMETSRGFGIINHARLPHWSLRWKLKIWEGYNIGPSSLSPYHTFNISIVFFHFCNSTFTAKYRTLLWASHKWNHMFSANKSKWEGGKERGRPMRKTDSFKTIIKWTFVAGVCSCWWLITQTDSLRHKQTHTVAFYSHLTSGTLVSRNTNVCENVMSHLWLLNQVFYCWVCMCAPVCVVAHEEIDEVIWLAEQTLMSALDLFSLSICKVYSLHNFYVSQFEYWKKSRHICCWSRFKKSCFM